MMSSSSTRPALTHGPNAVGVIGAGAFGQLMVDHLARHFRIVWHDPRPDMAEIALSRSVEVADLATSAACPVVLLAVPVQAMPAVVEAALPHIRPGSLVLDVGSVKVKPARLLERLLPENVDIVCTHPLFGPQSAASGLEGRKIALCNIRGRRIGAVAGLCRRLFGLQVIHTTPEAHDRELAYVQGLTHLIGKTILTMGLEPFEQTTVTYDLLMEAVGFIAHDSDALFKAIELENPFAAEARGAFFDAVRSVEERLAKDEVSEDQRPSAPKPTGGL